MDEGESPSPHTKILSHADFSLLYGPTQKAFKNNLLRHMHTPNHNPASKQHNLHLSRLDSLQDALVRKNLAKHFVSRLWDVKHRTPLCVSVGEVDHDVCQSGHCHGI